VLEEVLLGFMGTMGVAADRKGEVL
jgi:hypothetical protein